MSAALIAKLESASEGSRELDEAVMSSLGYSKHSDPRDAIDFWRGPDGLGHYAYHNVTTSIDAALALAERLLPGWGFTLSVWPKDRNDRPLSRCSAYDGTARFDADASTPALAICAALLRASAAKGAG